MPGFQWGRTLPSGVRVTFEEMISAALQAVDPFAAVCQAVQREGNLLTIAGRSYDLAHIGRLVVVGAGKAGAPMAAALEQILGDHIAAGWVNVKHGYTGTHDKANPTPSRIQLQEAGHPIPDEAGHEGAGRIRDLVKDLSEDDLVLCVLSGGGSALMPLPTQGITLAEKQGVTDTLLASGATINEINTVRKHISDLKGGQLARAVWPGQVVSLILSDVVGSPLDIIASGPTVPDPSTFDDALKVIEKYDLVAQLPASVRERLARGRARELADTPKPGDPIFDKVRNLIIGDNATAAVAATEKAQAMGWNSMLLSTYIEGEAREVARVVAGLAKEIAHSNRPLRQPACLVLGGETTVTLSGAGKGGRNQELALAAALALEGWGDAALLALATDGTDGPTDAAGAVIDGHSASRARLLGLDPQRHLREHDSYHFFEGLEDLIITGPTNTNVNDLTFVLVGTSPAHKDGPESTRPASDQLLEG